MVIVDVLLISGIVPCCYSVVLFVIPVTVLNGLIVVIVVGVVPLCLRYSLFVVVLRCFRCLIPLRILRYGVVILPVPSGDCCLTLVTLPIAVYGYWFVVVDVVTVGGVVDPLLIFTLLLFNLRRFTLHRFTFCCCSLLRCSYRCYRCSVCLFTRCTFVRWCVVTFSFVGC
jgi:hypothetical protein